MVQTHPPGSGECKEGPIFDSHNCLTSTRVANGLARPEFDVSLLESGLGSDKTVPSNRCLKENELPLARPDGTPDNIPSEFCDSDDELLIVPSTDSNGFESEDEPAANSVSNSGGSESVLMSPSRTKPNMELKPKRRERGPDKKQRRRRTKAEMLSNAKTSLIKFSDSVVVETGESEPEISTTADSDHNIYISWNVNFWKLFQETYSDCFFPRKVPPMNPIF